MFDKGKYQEKGAMIRKLWYERKAILKRKEELRLKPRNTEIQVNLCRSDPGPKRKTPNGRSLVNKKYKPNTG